MKRPVCWPPFVALVVLLCPYCCPADEQVSSAESLLAKWEEANKACRTLDMQFVRYSHDTVFDEEEISSGRYYWVLPKCGRYEIENGDGVRECLVWMDEGFYIVNQREKLSRFWPSKALTEARTAAERQPVTTWWARFVKGPVSRFASPEGVMPLLLHSDPAERERFELSVEEHEGRIIFRAVPRQSSLLYKEIDVMVEADTYRPVAHRVIGLGGERVTHLIFNQANASG